MPNMNLTQLLASYYFEKDFFLFVYERIIINFPEPHEIINLKSSD